MATAMTRTVDIDTLYSTTFAYSKRKWVNNIFLATRLLTFMASKKVVQPRGGTEWRLPVLMGRNNTVTVIDEGGEVSTEGDDPVRIARYEPKIMVASVKRVFTFEHKNAGKEQLIDMVDTSIDVAKNEISQTIEEYLCGEETKGLTGFAGMIKTDPTASAEVGGINQSEQSWWRNQTYALQGDAADYLSKDLRHLSRLCSKFGPTPDFVLTGGDVWEIIMDVLEEKHLFFDDEMKDLGWPDTPVFQHKPIVYSEEAPDETLRLVNSEDVKMFYDKALWFSLGDWIGAQTNVNRVAHIKCAWQLVSHRLASSGVLTAVDG